MGIQPPGDDFITNGQAVLGSGSEQVISNIDLVLGQGRIAGQSLLKDIGRSALQRLYTAIEQREDKRTP